MDKNGIKKILQFIEESEGLKKLLRHSWLSNGRRESVAEHSWRLALMAMVLSPKLNIPVNVGKVLMMVTIHDLCEIHAGDYWAFKGEKLDKHELEKEGLKKILKTQSKDIQKSFLELWEEYESCESEEAKFSQALDKIEVLIQHNQASLKTWNTKEKSKGFNLIYGDDKCNYDESLWILKELVREETKKKLKQG